LLLAICDTICWDSPNASASGNEKMPDPVYRSRAIANYLIEHSTSGLDPLQVMKLSYIAHGFTFGLYGRPLLEDDIEAWKYGPVVRKIYAFIPGGSSRISTPLSSERPDLTAEDETVVNSVLEKYGRYGGLYLSSLTHQPGSPWEKTWRKYGQNAVIPRDVIQSHYEGIVEATRAAAREGRPYHPTVL
jgi:uncharacterized phage-associated protein